MDRLSTTELTPVGRGAIATLLVTGPRAADAVAQLLPNDPRRPWPPEDDRRLELHWIGPPPAEQVVLRYRSPEAVEVHCHGGLAVRRIADLLETQGAVRRDWRQSPPMPGTSPIAADAMHALLAASTEPAAAILLEQLGGLLHAALRRMVGSLQAGRAADALEQIAALRRWTPLGLHLTRPWRVVLAGRPNVGKSSLLNALLGYTRALVHPMPGTTRDVLSALTAVAGWPVELIDTAGLRAAEDPLEQAGIGLAEQELTGADLVLLVCDASEVWSDADRSLHARCPGALVVNNKADLPSRPDPNRPAGQTVSALSGQGLDGLVETIARRLVPEIPPSGTAVPFTAEQDRALQAAAQAAQAGDLPGACRAIEGAPCFGPLP